MSRAYENAERVLAEGGDADDVLRAVVEALAAEPEVGYAAIVFVDAGELVVGPRAGEPDAARRIRIPVTYDGSVVGELWADGDTDRDGLERVAERLADYVLVGWDTGGEGWEP